MRNYRVLTLLLFSFLLLYSCKQETKNAGPSSAVQIQPALFDILTPEQTGINFQNELTETLAMNGLFYEYYYNGGGLAVADFNNDGLQDAYFIANLHPNKMYLNMGDMKFRDVSKESGTSEHAGFSTGVTVVDINNDGWMDLYISNSGRFEPGLLNHVLFVNQGVDKNGIPVFVNESAKYNLEIPLCGTQSAFFDYDRDNDLDLFLINHYPDIYNVSDIEKLLKTKSQITGDRLFRNQNGKFTDVSDKAGLINNNLSYGLGLGISDLNNDGWPDVYVSNDYAGKDFLYINNRNGTFSESIDESVNHVSFSSMGNYLGDFNNDGWSDIITLDMMAEDNYGIKASYGSMDLMMFQKLVNLGQHYQYMYNMLQMNNGVFSADKKPVFSEIAQLAGISSTDWSWGPLLFDMDNDGKKDLFVANGIKRDFINNDYLAYFEKRYKEVIETKKVNKNEFITSVLKQMPPRRKSNYFFRNNGDLTFEKMNGRWAKDVLTCSNGAAYADFDNDGDLDIMVNNSDSYSIIYKNMAREQRLGHYLQVKLKGPPKNQLGIGAKIVLEQGHQMQMQEQYLTRGFLSSVSPILHFGVGSDTIIPVTRIIWPDGMEETVRNYPADQTLTFSYANAGQKQDIPVESPAIFNDVTAIMKLDHKHRENSYNDFEREILLPHTLSDLGPGLAAGDVNNDGADDFYIGGSRGFPGALYLQTKSGFKASVNQPWTDDRDCEDMQAVFFDADGDTDLDLYVVSGGNEFNEGSQNLQDRIYMNSGSGNFSKVKDALPPMMISGSCVKTGDYDGDGDPDLFVGGRQKPGNYPFPASSRILRNDSRPGSIKFNDVTGDAAPELFNAGMVTDGNFVDIDGDKKPDLVIAGEWMSIRVFKNSGKTFKDVTQQSGLLEESGWWNCIATADFDHDGDMDLIAGNLGLNFKYKATKDFPFEIYAKDFDNNGKLEIVMGYYNNDTLYPLHGLRSSSAQLPFLRQKFPTFDAFARSTLVGVYGEENLKSALNLQVRNFATCYIENKGNFTFTVHRLPNPAQISSVNSILTEDIDGDGNPDLVIAGNHYGFEVETARNDASIGLFLRGDGKGNFEPVPARESGLMVRGDVREIRMIKNGKEKRRMIVVAKNNDTMQVIRINEK